MLIYTYAYFLHHSQLLIGQWPLNVHVSACLPYKRRCYLLPASFHFYLLRWREGKKKKNSEASSPPSMRSIYTWISFAAYSAAMSRAGVARLPLMTSVTCTLRRSGNVAPSLASGKWGTYGTYVGDASATETSSWHHQNAPAFVPALWWGVRQT